MPVGLRYELYRFESSPEQQGLVLDQLLSNDPCANQGEIPSHTQGQGNSESERSSRLISSRLRMLIFQ
jgi:hypothetical protein